MTDDNSPTSSESRRSFVQKSSLLSGALALGLTGTASAQEDQTETDTQSDDGEIADERKALMFNDEFRPGAQFRVQSPVLEQDPEVEGVSEGSIWSDYNTRIVEYLNTNEEVYFFPADAATVEQGTVYELRRNFSLFADDANDEGIMSVAFEPVNEGDVLFPGEDGQLEPGDDFELLDGGGKALVRGPNFYPGALLQITSDVVEWTPRADVQGTDPFSEYNTRHAEYLNTGDEIPIYTAQAGEFEQGAVYVVRDEFDITAPEGLLVTADLDRVNEDELDEDLL